MQALLMIRIRPSAKEHAHRCSLPARSCARSTAPSSGSRHGMATAQLLIQMLHHLAPIIQLVVSMTAAFPATNGTPAH